MGNYLKTLIDFLSLNSLIRISVVYVIPMCTLPLPFDTIIFVRTHKSSRYRYEKVTSYPFVPFEPIEWLENLQVARAELELGKCVPNSLYVSWSVFYSQMQL